MANSMFLKTKRVDFYVKNTLISIKYDDYCAKLHFFLDMCKKHTNFALDFRNNSEI